MKKLIVIVLCSTIFACTSKVKNDLSINKMKVIVWDMSCADELYNELQARDSLLKNKPNERIKLYNKVFELNKINKEDFYANYQYYLNNPQQLKVLLDSVQAYGQRQKDKSLLAPKVSAIP